MCQDIQEILQDIREDIQEGKATAIRKMAISLADMGFGFPPMDKIAAIPMKSSVSRRPLFLNARLFSAVFLFSVLSGGLLGRRIFFTARRDYSSSFPPFLRLIP